MSSLPIGADCAVSIQYTLTGDDGVEIESGQIDYLAGHGNIVPGLEAGLAGAVAGATVKVEVSAAEGYGERDEEEIQRVPRDSFPADLEIEAGMQFHAEGPDGESMPVWVVGIEEGVVLIDANHPLAGATLHFDVTVLAVRRATAEELGHGHVHGPDGHGHHH